MKKVITYGTFDHLHFGHIRLLERAKELGDYLIVGVTSDNFDKSRGKINVYESLVERIENVKKTGLADQIIVEEYDGQKIDDIIKYNIDIFAIGSDWKGKFDYLSEYCQIVYLERTKGISSTEIRKQAHESIRFGFIGLENPAKRFIAELEEVGQEITISGVYDTNNFDVINNFNLKKYSNIESFWEDVDIIYISISYPLRVEYIKKSLMAKKHVICESIPTDSLVELKEIFDLSLANKVMFYQFCKTEHFPCFKHLELMIKSKFIGEVVDINYNVGQNIFNKDKIKREFYHLYEPLTYFSLPLYHFFNNNDFINENTYFSSENAYARINLSSNNTHISSFIGVGIKTENHMIITGTEGYIYVPAPWWKPDYFEIRYEDIRKNRKYFYQYLGEGFRYGILHCLDIIYTEKYLDKKWIDEEFSKIELTIKIIQKNRR